MAQKEVGEERRVRGRPPVGTERVRLSVTLDRLQAERLEELAAAQGVSAATIVRQALNRYLEERG